jgi:hypothetical protein
MCKVCNATIEIVGNNGELVNRDHLHTIYTNFPRLLKRRAIQQLIEWEYPNAFNVIATVTSNHTLEISIAGYKSCIDLLNEETTKFLFGIAFGLGCMIRKDNRIYCTELTNEQVGNWMINRCKEYGLDEVSIIINNSYIEVNVNGSKYV